MANVNFVAGPTGFRLSYHISSCDPNTENAKWGNLLVQSGQEVFRSVYYSI